MSSITKRELLDYLEVYPDDAEVIINMHHKYDITKESGIKGWYAYINGIKYDELLNEILLMN